MTSYLLISLVLNKPERGSCINTPTNPQEWKRFFQQMDTLERAKIAEYKNGRYLLHSKRKADVVAQAEAVLTEISKPLSLEIAKEETPELSNCPRCDGKGRVKIDDVLGYFGTFLCLECYGKGKVAKPAAIIPPRETFPPMLVPVMHVTDAAPVLELPSVKAVVETPAIVIGDSSTGEKQHVRINMTGRGMSSGKYELLRKEEKYGRLWNVVKFVTDKEFIQYVSPEKCELVVN